nr:ORF1 [Torque teno midi virus]
MLHLTAKDFYKKSPFNFETQNQIWMSQLSDSHDNFCHCHCPFAHLLASIFPPGHQDRDLTINQILQRDFKECHSGGAGGESSGMAEGANPGTAVAGLKEEPNITEDEDLQGLLAAAADAEREDR